jgi:hypothetical protein
VAVQADPEGGATASALLALRAAGFKLFAWEARPTRGREAVVAFGADGYIGQAESEDQALACLALPPMDCPKAVIGNPLAWTKPTFDRLAAEGWDLILEWYWNAHPWESAPNAGGYPRFANVCFGLYDASGEHPGVGRRVGLDAYLAVWRGSWSGYLAETMTVEDWQTAKS